MEIDHRRAGKDVNYLNLTICAAMRRPGVYFHVLPTYNQGRKVIWDGIGRDGRPYRDYFHPAILAGKPNETEMKVRFVNGSVWQVVGAENKRDIDRIVGTNPVGVVFSEFALMSGMVWDLLRPVLAENQGWAAFVFTPRGKNHAFDLYQYAKESPEWYCVVNTIADTKREDGSPVVRLEDIEEERKAGMPEELIQQEFYCSFSAGMVGSYYATLIEHAEKEGRIGQVPWNPERKVDTFWDIGINDTTAIGFIQTPKNPAVRAYMAIDHIEENGVGLDYYVRELSKKPYNYGRHFFPHDMEIKEWGNAGKQRIQMARELGLKNCVVVPKMDRQDGIDAVRRVLPVMYFDKVKCKGWYEALRAYRKEYDEDRKVYKPTPLHDWSSNSADMTRYFATGFRPEQVERQVMARVDFDPLRYDRPFRGQRSAVTDFDPYGRG